MCWYLHNGRWVYGAAPAYFFFLFASVDNSLAPFLWSFSWPDFYISFIWELSRLGRRRGILVSLYISILTNTVGYFGTNTEPHTFCSPMFFPTIMLMLMMMAMMTMFVDQCLPMIIPLCLLTSQSYAAIQHDDDDDDDDGKDVII